MSWDVPDTCSVAACIRYVLSELVARLTQLAVMTCDGLVSLIEMRLPQHMSTASHGWQDDPWNEIILVHP